METYGRFWRVYGSVLQIYVVLALVQYRCLQVDARNLEKMDQNASSCGIHDRTLTTKCGHVVIAMNLTKLCSYTPSSCTVDPSEHFTSSSINPCRDSNGNERGPARYI